MEIESKIINPINIKITKTCKEIMEDAITNKKHSLTPGAMFGGEHYGFTIVSETNKGQKEVVYPTQCRIVAVGMIDGVLKIMEEGKYNPWIFNKNGKMLQNATFNKLSRRDLEYLAENFECYTEEDIEKVNTYVKR